MSQPNHTAEPDTETPAASSPGFAERLRAMLSLPATASEATVRAAVDALQGGAVEPPAGYVTREVYEATCRQLAEVEAEAHAAEEALRDALQDRPTASPPGAAAAVREAYVFAGAIDQEGHVSGCWSLAGAEGAALGNIDRIGADFVRFATAVDPFLPADIRAAGLARALNSRDPVASGDSATAVGLALNAEDGKPAPEWVQLTPTGPLLAGRDGRRFTITDPAAVVAATVAQGLPMVVDFEHASEIGDKGAGGAPAAGWIEELAVRAGQIWGRVVWTAKAGAAIAAREYRFISPAFNHTRDTAQNVVVLISAGLVHRPNFDMKALNARQGVSVLASLCKILGLPETASESESLTAVQALKDAPGRAANGAEVSLDRYVGRAIHEETVQALNAATAQLAARDADATRDRAERLVNDAVSAGKVTPATRGHYVTMALNAFDTTAALIGALPVIVPGGESDAAARAGRDLGRAGATSLNDQQRAICANLGLDEVAYAASLAAETRAAPRPRA